MTPSPADVGCGLGHASAGVGRSRDDGAGGPPRVLPAGPLGVFHRRTGGRGMLMGAVRDKLLSSGFARDAAVVMIGTGVGQALNFASSPVLTRLYQPEQLGSLGRLLALYSVLTPLACWRDE